MKKTFVMMIFFLCALSLSARENPFEPTDTYKEKQIEYLKQLELEEQQQKKLQEQMQLQEEAMVQREKELEDLEMLKQEELRKIESLKVQRAMLEKDQQQKLLQIEQKKMIQHKQYNVLPFVHIDTADKELTLLVDTKFQLINQDILPKRKKMLYDFKGHTSFYTINKKLNSDYFKSFSVGTHKKDGFFRVVIELSETPSSYLENVNPQEGKIVILKKD